MKFAKLFFCFLVIAWVTTVQTSLAAAATSTSETLRVFGLKESVEILNGKVRVLRGGCRSRTG
jgi:hypothetical protein